MRYEQLLVIALCILWHPKQPRMWYITDAQNLSNLLIIIRIWINWFPTARLTCPGRVWCIRLQVAFSPVIQKLSPLCTGVENLKLYVGIESSTLISIFREQLQRCFDKVIYTTTGEFSRTQSPREIQ